MICYGIIIEPTTLILICFRSMIVRYLWTTWAWVSPTEGRWLFCRRLLEDLLLTPKIVMVSTHWTEVLQFLTLQKHPLLVYCILDATHFHWPDDKGLEPRGVPGTYILHTKRPLDLLKFEIPFYGFLFSEPNEESNAHSMDWFLPLHPDWIHDHNREDLWLVR